MLTPGDDSGRLSATATSSEWLLPCEWTEKSLSGLLVSWQKRDYAGGLMWLSSPCVLGSRRESQGFRGKEGSLPFAQEYGGLCDQMCGTFTSER